MIKCFYRTSSQFYIDDETGNTCLDVCRLKAQDEDGMIYLEDAIVSDNDCLNCPLMKNY